LPLSQTLWARRQQARRIFSNHAIKVVVPYPAGGPTDTIARVTQNLSLDLGQAVIVEN
jgi:tripartite-type tricarboxylate transporter receptor subunit TctC